MIFDKLFGRKAAAPAEPIVKELILPREAAENSDPYKVIDCTIQYYNYLLHTAYYRPAEVIQEPMWSYQVDYYIGQVNNGGHGQYVGNSGITSGELGPTIEATQRGLAAMGAHDYGAIYSDLLRLLNSNQKRAAAIAEGRGFGEIDPAIEKLDQRFFAIKGTDRLIRQNRDFLLALKSLRLVPFASWQAEMVQLARLNPNGQERALAAKRAQEERDAKDPHLLVAKELCRRADCSFGGWTTVNPGCKLDGQDVSGWFAKTDKGLVAVFFLADEALLFRHEPDVPPMQKMTPEQLAEYVTQNNEKLLTAFHFNRSKNLLATLKLSRG